MLSGVEHQLTVQPLRLHRPELHHEFCLLEVQEVRVHHRVDTNVPLVCVWRAVLELHLDGGELVLGLLKQPVEELDQVRVQIVGLAHVLLAVIILVLEQEHASLHGLEHGQLQHGLVADDALHAGREPAGLLDEVHHCAVLA